VDGYGYALASLGVDCGDLANQKLATFERDGIWQGSFEELSAACLMSKEDGDTVAQTL
jgi:hypothetical protein